MATINPILEQALQEEIAAADVANASISKLQAVESALAVSTAQLKEDRAKISAGITREEQLVAEAQGAFTDITASNQITSRAKLNANLAEQNQNIEVLEAAGGHDAQTALMAELTQEGDELSDLKEEKADRMQEEHTGFGPLDTIINALSTIDTDQQIKAKEAERDDTARQIALVTGSQEAFAKVNALTKKTLNEAVIEANYKGIAADGKIKGIEMEIKNIHSNAEALGRLATADARTVSNALEVYRLDGESRQREIRDREADIKKLEIEQREKLIPIQLATAEANLAKSEIDLASAKATNPDAIAATNARNRQLVTEVKRLQEANVERADDARRGFSGMGLESNESTAVIIGKLDDPRYQKAQELGAISRGDPLGFTFGTTFAGAHNNRALMDPNNIGKPTNGTQLADRILQAQRDKYIAAPDSIPKKGDIEGLNRDLNNTATAKMLEFATNIDGSGNPFVAPPMTVLTDFMTSIVETPLYEKVLAAKGFTEADPASIMNAAVEGVASGTISPEEAADGIETLYEAAAQYNNTIEGGFRRVGLPNQTTYNVQLPNPQTNLDRLGLLVPSVGGVFTESVPKALTFVPTLDEPLAPINRLVEAKREVTGIFGSPIVTVDLMDGTQIGLHIAQVMSGLPAVKKQEEKPTGEGE